MDPTDSERLLAAQPIESVHDTVHSWAGFAESYRHGHMAKLEYAAFDPLFWLHHW